ncbi:MAG: DUF370 domain-containing protein [Clostridia bacterium]|nr:DUF370 domain-containing protein [Clostridia bacterium]
MRKIKKYVNVGQSVVISSDEIIGIFDIDTATVKKDTRNFLKRAEKENITKNAFDPIFDIPVSFILTKGQNDAEKLIFSSVSTSTLENRL